MVQLYIESTNMYIFSKCTILSDMQALPITIMCNSEVLIYLSSSFRLPSLSRCMNLPRRSHFRRFLYMYIYIVWHAASFSFPITLSLEVMWITEAKTWENTKKKDCSHLISAVSDYGWGQLWWSVLGAPFHLNSVLLRFVKWQRHSLLNR